ncbi:hypothetical protein AK89_03440 [Enterococcus mundtii CRL35]|nr:hypothetical protein AK89_03440 [Enterococcus mundtii CRL35]
MMLVQLSKFLFWFPFSIAALAFFYFFKITKRTFSIFLAACPVIFFIVKITTYYFYDSVRVFLYYEIGLLLSVIFFISVLYYFYKKR